MGAQRLGDYMDFAAEPFLANKARPADAFLPLGTYNDPADMLSGDAPTETKVVMRPKSGAAPGWPGFFGWLAATSPDMYNYMRVALPDVVGDRQGIVAAGSQLGYIGADDELSPVAITAQRVSVQAATEGVTDSTPLPTTTLTGQIVAALSNAAQAFLPLYSQKQLLDVQVARARQGLPPLDTSRYESATQGLNVGVNKSTQNTMLMIAAIGGGVLLLSQLLKRGR